jgi:hypothetical protein
MYYLKKKRRKIERKTEDAKSDIRKKTRMKWLPKGTSSVLFILSLHTYTTHTHTHTHTLSHIHTHIEVKKEKCKYKL